MTEGRILVDRARLVDARVVGEAPRALGEGEVRVKTGRFALTANNVTYGVAGDMVGYWHFFPADAPDGVIPVWGFGEVVESRSAALPVGSRLWGFLPLASHVVMLPGQVSARGFVDMAAHRQALPGLYNHYALTAGDSDDLKAAGDARSLWFPLLMTGFVLADWLQDNDAFGAGQVIIGSASSKTAIGLAHHLGAGGPARVGLTSAENRGFVEALGLYERVLDYGSVESLDAGVPAVFVDMAGSRAVTAAVHGHFGDGLKASVAVGMTHWQERGAADRLPGPKPEFFFAPTQIEKRDRDWGPGELRRRADAANLALVRQIGRMVEAREVSGATAIRDAWVRLVDGKVSPSEGLLCSF
jgi:hypothetical protein